MSKVIDVILQLKDNMTGPMSRATSKLKENASQYQRLGKSIQRTGKKISSAGSALTKTITAPAVALGAVAFKEYGEYDKQMRLVQQTMGSTEEESKMLGDAIKEAAKNSVYGMKDAADAALNYARAGYNAKEAADLMAPSLNLAAGTGSEIQDVTKGMSVAMKAFGADTSEASKYTDIFQKSQAQALVSLQDLFDSTQKAGSVFTTAGWDIKDLAVATGVLGDETGATGSVIGTALKSGIANLTPTTKSAVAWFERLGLNFTNADGTFKSFLDTQYELHDAFSKLTPVEQKSAAQAIFGKHHFAKWLAIIKRSPDEVQKLADNLNNLSGESKNAANALMSGPGGAIEKLKSNWDVFKNTLGETLAPVLTPMVEKLTEMLQAFSNLTDEQKKNIVKWVAIAAAVGPCLSIFGKVVTGIGTVIKMFGSLGKAIKGGSGIFKLFAGAPKGAMLGALGAIGIAISVIIRNWDKVTEMFKGFYSKIKPALDKIMPIFKKIFGFISDVIDNVAMGSLKTFLDAIESIAGILGGVCDFIGGVFSGDWEKMWTGLKDIVVNVFKGIANLVIGVVNTIIGAINTLIDGVNWVLNSVRKTDSWAKNIVASSPELQKAAEEKGIDWKNMGGGGIPNIPSIPTLAKGTDDWQGGVVQVSEKGGEIIDLPSGSRVYPHDESVQKAYKEGLAQTQATTLNIKIPKLADQIIVREDADIDRIATKLAHKLEKVSQNVGGSRIGYQFQS